MRRIGLAAVAGVLALAASAAAGDLLDRVLAVVSGNVITLSDARAAMALGVVAPGNARDPMEAAVEALIDRRLVLDEVIRYASAVPDPALVAHRLAQMKAKFPDEQAWTLALTRVGLSDAEATEMARDDVRVQRYVEHRFEAVLPPTDEEIREYYAANQQQFVRDGRPLTLDEARDTVVGRLQAERRRQAVDAWIERLRRRADVIVLYLPQVR